MRKEKAQSIMEYAILIGIVSAAIMAMNVYVKRGVQAGIKFSADQMGSQKNGMLSKDYDKQETIRLSQYESGQNNRDVVSLASGSGSQTRTFTYSSTNTGKSVSENMMGE